MKERILKLCKRLNKFSQADIETISGLRPYELMPILYELQTENIIDEVNHNAVIRSKAINIRDYAGASILEENKTVLNLTNSQIWSGGFAYEEVVSEDEVFSALGSANMGTAKLVINNMSETYSDYDFTNAVAVLYLAMEFPYNNTTRQEKHKIGTYTVDSTNYNGALITLTLLDNMEKFDRPYASNLIYPRTLFDIVKNACDTCGVTLNTLQFPNYNFSISVKPDTDSRTYRDVIGWCAAIAGCFAKCNPDGKLELKWFDQDTLENQLTILDGGTIVPWSAGEDGEYSGGTVEPWTEGDTYTGGEGERSLPIHYITSLYSQNIAVDDVVITGIQITVDSNDVSTDPQVFTQGTTGYVISIEGNNLITTTNVTTIINYLSTQLIGLRFRKLNLTHTNDPSIEAGDIALIYDRKGRGYVALITRTTFNIGGAQTLVCGASTPSRNSATTYSALTKNIVDVRKLLKVQKTAWEQAMDELGEQLDEKAGLYSTIETTASGNIYYLHDQPDLSDSAIVWKMTRDAWGVTTNYNGASTVWNGGMTVDGTAITRILSTIGLDFDWGVGGELTIEDTQGNETMYVNADTGVVRIAGAFTWNSTNSSMTSNGTLSCQNATISGIINAGPQSSIGALAVLSDRFYSGNRNFYNIDEEGICIETNGNFGISGKAAFWSRSVNDSTNQIQMFEWTPAPISGQGDDNTFHLRVSHGTTESNQVAVFNVDCLTGDTTIGGALSVTGNIRSGNRTNFNTDSQSGVIIESVGSIGGGNGTANGTSAGWWRNSSAGDMKCSGEIVSEKRTSAGAIQGYVSIGQGHANSNSNNAICVNKGNSNKFTVRWDGTGIFTKTGQTLETGILCDCSGVVNIVNGDPSSDTNHAIDVVRFVANSPGVVSFYVTYAGYVFGTSTNLTSDERLKNIVGSCNHKDLFMALNPVEFTWRNSFIRNDTTKHIGVGAQTLKRQMKEHGCDDLGLVTCNEKDDTYAVNYIELLMLSVPIIQAHEKQIAELESENKVLKKHINDLESRIAKLEEVILNV